MSDRPLDEIDRAILHLLQEDARNRTPVDLAAELPVSDGTVRNRIGKLERTGVIQGYVPRIDYEAAGFPLRIAFTCTANVRERADLARAALGVHGVVNVREVLTGNRNVRVVGVATATDDISRIGTDLADLGLEVEVEELLRREYEQPWNHFGQDLVE